jgi:hypothetical protein
MAIYPIAPFTAIKQLHRIVSKNKFVLLQQLVIVAI